MSVFPSADVALSLVVYFTPGSSGSLFDFISIFRVKKTRPFDFFDALPRAIPVTYRKLALLAKGFKNR